MHAEKRSEKKILTEYAHISTVNRENQKKNENKRITKQRDRTHLNNCRVSRLQMKQRGAKEKKRIKIPKYIWIE